MTDWTSELPRECVRALDRVDASMRWWILRDLVGRFHDVNGFALLDDVVVFLRLSQSDQELLRDERPRLASLVKEGLAEGVESLNHEAAALDRLLRAPRLRMAEALDIIQHTFSGHACVLERSEFLPTETRWLQARLDKALDDLDPADRR